ncbi:hypothetical protein B0T16DRAFT_392744 [Cercophora newfieldiana]|uniref:Uncharacterized protein n=1 Tax=Cercophora newfieldiana TaxID=92897 RepID=A0AA39Y1Q4_9PEZI|nr:hypothetical protein B0T16DRAFT_392744 [Cercophora newfieldiana]
MNLPRGGFACLFALLAVLAIGPLLASARAVSTGNENAVALLARAGKANSSPQQSWVCRPQRLGWCTISIIVEYNNVPNIHSELFDENCDSLAVLPHMSWGTIYTFSSSILPRSVRILVKPVMSAVSPDASEFWYGDGHWTGNWEQFIEGNMTENNFKGISTRPFDCSFTQGHNASVGAALKVKSAGVVGALVGALLAWVIAF